MHKACFPDTPGCGNINAVAPLYFLHKPGKLAFPIKKFIRSFNPDISYRFVPRVRKRAWIQGARRAGNVDILDNMSRRPNKRNAVDMPDCAASVETV